MNREKSEVDTWQVYRVSKTSLKRGCGHKTKWYATFAAHDKGGFPIGVRTVCRECHEAFLIYEIKQKLEMAQRERDAILGSLKELLRISTPKCEVKCETCIHTVECSTIQYKHIIDNAKKICAERYSFYIY